MRGRARFGGDQDESLAVAHPGQPADIAAVVITLMTVPAVTGTVVDVDGSEFLGEFE